MPGINLPRRQRGITLLIGLLMLIMLTLMGIAAFKFSNLNSMMAANSQHRMEATRAAEQALETVISTTAILDAVPAGWTKDAATNNYQRAFVIDVNGGGANYNVTVTRTTCVSAVPIRNSTLDLTSEQDLACVLGVAQNFGVAGAISSDSLCAEVIREARAVATDALNQTRMEVVLGYGVRASTEGLTAACN